MADDAEAKSILVATTIEAAGSKLRKLKSVPGFGSSSRCLYKTSP
jgi:hypothetical protein